MRLPFLFAVAFLFTLLPAGQSQEPPPAAPPAEVEEDDVAVPSWVAVDPPCEPEAVPDDPPRGDRPAELSTDGSTASPQVVVEPSAGSDRLAFNYDSTAGTVDFDYRSPEATDHRMRIDFEWLHEFIDQDGDGRLDDGEPILQSQRVAGNILHYARTWEEDCGIRLQWVYLLTVTADDIAGMGHEEQAAFLEDKPRLTLRFTHLAAGQQGFSPERVKIDIGIDAYEYRDAGSVLAFTTIVASQEEAAGSRSEAVTSRAGGTTLAYTWLPTADADGQTVQVSADVSPAGEGTNVTFVYPQAESILHDPELGLLDVLRRLLDAADLDGQALGVGVAAGTVTMAAILVGRRRWP